MMLCLVCVFFVGRLIIRFLVKECCVWFLIKYVLLKIIILRYNIYRIMLVLGNKSRFKFYWLFN